MRIFVTGGTGFVGRHAVAELLKRGHTLLVLSRGKHKRSRRLTYLRGNLSNIARWERALRRFKPQAALHMAWEGIPDYGPETSLKNLVNGVALVHALGRAGCKKVVATGSCWEYGAESGKIAEDSGLRFSNPFPAAKAALHRIGAAAAAGYDMDFVWGRIFYVYGPGQKSASLIPHLIEMKRSNRMPGLRNPNGANDFVYVGDVARALGMLVAKRTPSKVFNIGSGRATGVRTVAREIYGRNVVPAKGAPRGFYADLARIKRELGWKPATGIEEGIRRTIVSF